jgi:hypothetical protein
VHTNGTIYIVCGGSFIRAESISGPWVTVSNLNPKGSGPSGNYEDPFLYNDKRGWHLIYHVFVSPLLHPFLFSAFLLSLASDLPRVCIAPTASFLFFCISVVVGI